MLFRSLSKVIPSSKVTPFYGISIFSALFLGKLGSSVLYELKKGVSAFSKLNKRCICIPILPLQEKSRTVERSPEEAIDFELKF